MNTANSLSYKPLSTVDILLRRIGYAYIVLVVLEGALRKWVLPQFSDVLLVARDPLVLYAYFICITRRCFPMNRYVIVGFLLTCIGVVLALAINHGSPLVAGFGFRSNFLHVPFAFIMAQTFYRSDVIEIGKYWLLGTIAMTVLIALQFSEPQSAWINRSVGGGEGGGFYGAAGRYRPPGTFSFTTGTTWFYSFSVAFLIAGMTQHKRYGKALLVAASIAVIIAIPLSISRALVLFAAITVIVALYAASLQKQTLIRIARVIALMAVGFVLAYQIPVFSEATNAFLKRWENSTSADQGGVKIAIFERAISNYTDPFIDNLDSPFFGIGIGAATQVGTKYLTGEHSFVVGEGEWYRLIGECGLFLGSLFIAWRIWIVGKLFSYCIIALRKSNGLGLILLTVSAKNILSGQWGQTTIYGFTIIGLALTIAAMRPRPIIEKPKTASSKKETSPSPQTSQPSIEAV